MVFDKLSKSELEILNIAKQCSKMTGIESYAVGGFVRDKLLHRPTNDIDILCIGDGIAFARAYSDLLPIKAPVTVFKNYGTAMLKFNDIDVEFVGARKESYESNSRNPSVSPGTLEDDLGRRDFTVNALAVRLDDRTEDLKMVDLFNGLDDLHNQLIRTPKDPFITLDDDPLRMMRAIRFTTQLDYRLVPELLQSIQSNAERIKIISQERITTEINKIMLSKKPSIGFKLMEKTGLLPYILPELQMLKGVEIRDGVGHKDNFYHTLQVLDNVAQQSENLWLRWAALLHDIAKPPTKRFDSRSGWTFHGHEVVGSKMVPKIFKRLKLPLDEKMKYVKKLVLLHLRPISLTKDEITDSAIRRLLFDAGEDLDDLLTLCNCDVTSKNEAKVARIKQNFAEVKRRLIEVEEKDKIRNWQPPISGDLIMATFDLRPSRTVGEIKDAIREAILDGDIKNDYEAAFQFMLSKGTELGLKASNSTLK